MYTAIQFRSFLKNHAADEICAQHIFGDDPWLFSKESAFRPRATYQEFRQAVADGVGSSVNDVFLTGSSVFGRSTNPEAGRFNRSFSAQSDLDVVIISEDLFSDSWNQLRMAYYKGYPEILNFHGKYVFRGFVREPDRHFGSTSLRKLITKTLAMKSDVQKLTGITLPLKYRIYRDFQSAFEYHLYGIEKCKKLISP